MAESLATLTHPTYTFVEEKDADAIGWIFVNGHEMKRIPFKFPPIKPHEIRAKVTYTGLCLTDAHIVDGRYFPCNYPICPGHEIVGIVTHIGDDVKDFKIGDKVGFGTHREFCGNCEFCQKGYDNLCCKPTEQLTTYGAKYWGGYATSIQHPAQCYFKLPEGLPEEKIAPLFCAGITCYNPVARYTQPGDEVAVLAVGGLGHMAVQYAKAKGCKVTAFTSSLSKEEFIKKLGADRVVLNTPENLKAEAKKYHLIINTLPDVTEFTPLTNLARTLGVFCQVGGCEKGASFNPMTLLFGNISVVGSNTGSVQEIKEMLEFSAKHNITPICEQFDFEDMPKAFDRLVNGKPIFRCVVDMTKAGPKKN